MKTVLLTGFEPFGGESVNASQEVVRSLDGAETGGHDVRGFILPCEFGRAEKALAGALRQTKPAVVICLGQASGRRAVTPERVAVNLDDAELPDNAGRQRLNTPVVRGGPVAYWSTLPVDALVVAMKAQGLPAEASRTAGGFVCNHVFYALMHRLARRWRAPRAGFIHVPRIGLPDDATPGLPLGVMIQAIRTAIAVCVAPAP